MSSPNFQLCAFPLEKVPASLRLHIQLVSGTALTKERLLYCSQTKSVFCIIGYTALLSSLVFILCERVYQTSFCFSRGKGAFEQFSQNPRVKEKGKICKLSATSTAIRLLLAKGIRSLVLSPALRVLSLPSRSPPCFPRFYHVRQGARRLDLTNVIEESKKGVYHERQKKIITI